MNQWRKVIGYEGLYEVSSLGQVRSLSTNRVLRGGLSAKGYVRVNLYSRDRIVKTMFVHVLVATAFLEKEAGRSQVNHMDGVKTNNNVSNLEWCTGTENMRHAVRTGLHRPKPVCRICQYSSEIIQLRAKGLTTYEIGTAFGFSAGTVGRFLKREGVMNGAI